MPRKEKIKSSKMLKTTKGRKRVEDKERNNEQGQTENNKNMVSINPAKSIITLQVKGLNAPIGRQKLSGWISKKDPAICCLQETHFKYKETYGSKLHEWRNI